MTCQSALLISPAFFGYERVIANELRAKGYQVDFLDERPSNSSFERAVLRVKKSLAAPHVAAYYGSQSVRLKSKQYDLVIVVKGEVVPRWFLKTLRDAQPRARFVFYAYDSIANSPRCVELFDLFDECFSFDPVESDQWPQLSYKPLFYASEFRPCLPGTPPRYDISFVGTLHSGRYALVKKLFSAFNERFEFFYVPARWYFNYGKYLSGEFAEVSRDDVSFDTLSREQVAEIFRSSRAVLDIQRTGQAGLTMRTFEVLASGAMLITTNSQIIHEDFYDPSRIIILPENESAWDQELISRRIADHTPSHGAPAGFDAHSSSTWVEAFA